MITKRSIQKELYRLFNTFFLGREFEISIKCLDLHNAYNSETDEVVIYTYKVYIIVKDKLYVYDGWCYEEDLKQVALGIFSHWLLSTHELYKGQSTTWYNMYTCLGNICSKEDFE